MESQASLIEALFEKTERYAKVSTELFKLKAIGKSADIISTLTTRFIVMMSGVLFFLLFNIGVAFWIGKKLGETYYGFFSVAGFYALAGLVLYAFHDQWIKTPLRNSIISQALK
jgi:hypothetical protein